MSGQKPAKDVYVTVKVTDVAAEKFEFESSDLPVGPDNHLTFDDGKDFSGFNIFYTLEGADGYKFPKDDLNEALYVKGGSSTYCPQSKSQWGQFQAVDVLDDGRTLKVWNKNDAKAKFAYMMRAKKGSDWLELDPGGTNNNAGGDGTISAAGAIVGAIAAVALLTVAYIALR